MKMSNNVYDILKKVALIILPALATLWLTIGKIWGLPYTTEIGATVTAISVFLGTNDEINKKLANDSTELALIKQQLSTIAWVSKTTLGAVIVAIVGAVLSLILK